MMGMFSWLTSAPKVVDNIFDKDKGLLTQVGSWIGGQQFTAEEQAEHSAEMAKGVRAFAVATMEENTDRSKARREIAKAWFELQIWLVKLNVMALPFDYIIEILEGPEVDFSRDVASIAFNPYVWGITSAVSLFFFGAHIMRGSKWAKDK